MKVHQEVHGSDHAPLSITLDMNKRSVVPTKDLVERAAVLGQTQWSGSQTAGCKLRKSLSYKKIDADKFVRTLNLIDPPQLMQESDIDAALSSGYETIINTAKNCMRETQRATGDWRETESTWARIMHSNDNKLLWKSINWKGSLEIENKERPSDNNFKEHVEKLLNPENIPDKKWK